MSKFYLKDKIESWDKRELIEFCLFCCYKVKHMMSDQSLTAVELVERWLEDETSLSKKDLRDVAYHATVTDSTANYTAYYIAIYAANYTTDYIAYAANWTVNAAHNAAKAINSSQEALYLEYMRSKLSDIMES